MSLADKVCVEPWQYAAEAGESSAVPDGVRCAGVDGKPRGCFAGFFEDVRIL